MVRSQWPSAVAPNRARLAIVGEAPGLEETTWQHCACGREWPGEKWEHGSIRHQPLCPWCGRKGQLATRPFVGPSGYSLDERLREAGFARPWCFAANVLNFLPAGRLDAAEWARLEARTAVQQCLDLLADELNEFKPHCVLALGGVALWAFHPERANNPWDGEGPAITDWRGSIFEGTLPDRSGGPSWRGKVVAALHPAAVLRQPEWLPFLRFDVKRAVAEAATPALDLPAYEIVTPATAPEACDALDALRACPPALVGFDLEGYANTGVTDLSFALSTTRALWVPFRHGDGSPWWAPADEQRIWTALRAVLEDGVVPKVLHNALYEMFVLRWGHDITLRGVTHDTMLLFWEHYCELQNRLAVAASLFTRQPYWKEGRAALDDGERARYNCTDSCVTLQCAQAMLASGELSADALAHYRANLGMLEALLDIELAGFRADNEARIRLVEGLQQQAFEANAELDALAGIPALPGLPEVAAAVCYKRALGKVRDWPDLVPHAKPTFAADAARIAALLGRNGPSPVPAIPPEATVLVLEAEDAESDIPF